MDKRVIWEKINSQAKQSLVDRFRLLRDENGYPVDYERVPQEKWDSLAQSVNIAIKHGRVLADSTMTSDEKARAWNAIGKSAQDQLTQRFGITRNSNANDPINPAEFDKVPDGVWGKLVDIAHIAEQERAKEMEEVTAVVEEEVEEVKEKPKKKRGIPSKK